MADSQLSGAGAFPLALRPAPAEADGDESSLISQLARISNQFGQFRHMNEDKLREMIANQEAGRAEGVEQPDDEDETSDDAKKRADELRQAKADMFKHINDAQQEILYTIDFLGLLLTKDSARGANYMSPTLKQSGVPEGAFAYDKWPPKQPDDRQKKQQDLVAKGWTMEGLGASADSLLQAATKLEKEVRKETQYWGQILSIKKRGWSLRRVPRESGTLGVQFGFLEASPKFQARGFAALRAKDDGSIILDQALVRKPKSIRVRILDNGKVRGSSHQTSLAFAPQSDLEIEDLIRRARDSLFEEELFQEMTMESRNLLSQNVRFRDHAIIIPTGLAQQSSDDSIHSREIHVDLVGVNDVEDLPAARSEDGLADDIALALRLLLTHAHSQRQRRRIAPPPPMTDRPRPELPFSIIRTMLNFIHHHAATSALRSYLSSHQKILSRAGLSLNTTFESAYSSLLDAVKANSSPQNRIPSLDALIAALSRPLQTTATFSLPSTSKETAALHEDLAITLRTLVAPPIQGTDISLVIPSALATVLYHDHRQGQRRTLSFDSLEDLTEYLDNAVSMDIAHSIASKAFKNCVLGERTPDIMYLIGSKKDTAPLWGSKPENAEGTMVRMTINISGKTQNLRVVWFAPDADLEGDEAVWTDDGGESRSFMDVVQKFANTPAP